MRGHDAVADREAEPRSVASRREERLEHPITLALRYSGAVVVDAKNVPRGRGAPDDTHVTAAARLPRVPQQVDEDLAHSHGVDVELRFLDVDLRAARAFSGGVPLAIDRLADEGAEGRRRSPERRALRVGREVFGDSLADRGLFVEDRELFAER